MVEKNQEKKPAINLFKGTSQCIWEQYVLARLTRSDATKSQSLVFLEEFLKATYSKNML